MTNLKSCTIRLLNKNYEIKCPELEHEHLKLAALRLNEQIIEKKKKFKRLENFDALLLAALHISHQLVTSETEQGLRREKLSQFICALERKISQAAADIAHLKPAIEELAK